MGGDVGAGMDGDWRGDMDVGEYGGAVVAAVVATVVVEAVGAVTGGITGLATEFADGGVAAAKV